LPFRHSLKSTYTHKFRFIKESSESSGRMELDSINPIFDAFRPDEIYTTLLQNIKIDDIITVYSGENHPHTYTDVYQIEKKGQIIQSYENYRKNSLILVVSLVVLGLGFLVYCIWQLQNKSGAT